MPKDIVLPELTYEEYDRENAIELWDSLDYSDAPIVRHLQIDFWARERQLTAEIRKSKELSESLEDALTQLDWHLKSRATAISRAVGQRQQDYITKLQNEVDNQQRKAELLKESVVKANKRIEELVDENERWRANAEKLNAFLRENTPLTGE